jgi:hypothetical protein
VRSKFQVENIAYQNDDFLHHRFGPSLLEYFTEYFLFDFFDAKPNIK